MRPENGHNPSASVEMTEREARVSNTYDAWGMAPIAIQGQ
jgi:hypothetical protein